MEYLFLIIIVFLLAYLVFDYFSTFQTEKFLERLNVGFDDREEEQPSLWTGAADLFQLEALRNLLYESALTRTFDIRIKRADLKISLLQAIVLLHVISIVIAILAKVYFASAYAFIGGLIISPIVIWKILATLSARQQKKHDNQLSALISSLLTTMHGGGTPIQALQSIAKNATKPMNKSIANVMNNLQIGRSPNIVWQEWAKFWDTKNTRLLATGIRLKWETGGQMTTILEHILDTIEFNKRIELRIGTLTAQAKLSAYVLSIMPLALGLLQYHFRPDLMMMMINDDIGKFALIYASVSTMLGFLWLRKIAELKP